MASCSSRSSCRPIAFLALLRHRLMTLTPSEGEDSGSTWTCVGVVGAAVRHRFTGLCYQPYSQCHCRDSYKHTLHSDLLKRQVRLLNTTASVETQVQVAVQQ